MPALRSVRALMERVEGLKGKRLEAEKMLNFFESLLKNGFINTNGALTPLVDYVGYKVYYGVEEFEGKNGTKVVVEYLKEAINGKVTYYVKDVEVYGK
jgi:hypothetical protein